MLPHLSAPLLLLAAIACPSSAFVPHLPSASTSPTKIGTKIGTAHVVLASAADANDDAGADDDAAAAAPPASGSEDETAAATATETKKKKATLGFITFDLDDTLYPVGPVFTEANQA